MPIEFAGTQVAYNGKRYPIGDLPAEPDEASGGSAITRFGMHTNFEGVDERYNTVAGSSGAVTITGFGLNVTAGVDPNETALLVFADQETFRFDKNLEFVVRLRIDNVDIGVNGDDIDFFVGWGGEPDKTETVGLVFNAVTQLAEIVTGDDADSTRVVLPGVNPTVWNTYRLTYDGTTVTASANDGDEVTTTETLPTVAYKPLNIRADNKTNLENAGAIQVTALSVWRDL